MAHTKTGKKIDAPRDATGTLLPLRGGASAKEQIAYLESLRWLNEHEVALLARLKAQA
jgi:hypothetical protein